MSLRTRTRVAAQAMGEYAIFIAGIAIVVVAAVVLIGVAVTGRYGHDDKSPGIFQPPVGGSSLSWPTTLGDCENDGWRNYAQFRDEGECRSYIETLSP